MQISSEYSRACLPQRNGLNWIVSLIRSRKNKQIIFDKIVTRRNLCTDLDNIKGLLLFKIHGTFFCQSFFPYSTAVQKQVIKPAMFLGNLCPTVNQVMAFYTCRRKVATTTRLGEAVAESDFVNKTEK